MKTIDWHLVISELLKRLSQQELAELCGVSQQNISNWKNRKVKLRTPAKQKLSEIAQQEGIDVSKFETAPKEYTIPKHLEKGNAKDLARIFEVYREMSKGSRAELLGYVNSLVKKGGTMEDIEPTVKKYCDDMTVALTQTMERYKYPEYQPLWEIFIADIKKGDYCKHFNFRVVNGEVSVQARTNVGMAITDYTDRLGEGE
jgi:transcriptional regulator with XRE-family HTH domain